MCGVANIVVLSVGAVARVVMAVVVVVSMWMGYIVVTAILIVVLVVVGSMCGCGCNDCDCMMGGFCGGYVGVYVVMGIGGSHHFSLVTCWGWLPHSGGCGAVGNEWVVAMVEDGVLMLLEVWSSRL